MVYDFSKGFDNAAVTTADTVYVKMTEDKLNLKLIFKNGESFENLEKGEGFDFENVPDGLSAHEGLWMGAAHRRRFRERAPAAS